MNHFSMKGDFVVSFILYKHLPVLLDFIFLVDSVLLYIHFITFICLKNRCVAISMNCEKPYNNYVYLITIKTINLNKFTMRLYEHFYM